MRFCTTHRACESAEKDMCLVAVACFQTPPHHPEPCTLVDALIILPDELSPWTPWPEWAIDATAGVMGWRGGEVPTAKGVLDALAEAARDALERAEP